METFLMKIKYNTHDSEKNGIEKSRIAYCLIEEAAIPLVVNADKRPASSDFVEIAKPFTTWTQALEMNISYLKEKDSITLIQDNIKHYINKFTT